MPNIGRFSGVGGNVLGSVTALAASPFSREAAQDVGTSFGNAISAVPGLRDVVGSRAGGAVASAAPSLYGTENLRAYTDAFRSGNIGEAAKQGALTVGNWYLTGKVGGKATQSGVAAARTGGISSFLPAFASAAKRYTVPQSIMSLVNAGLTAKQISDVTSGRALAYEQSKMATPGAVAAGVVTPEQAKAGQDAYKRYGSLYGGYGQSGAEAYAKYGPLYGAGSAESPVLGLSAAQQLEFENRLRDIEAETQAVLSGLSGQASSARSEAKAGREESRRQVAGGSQDLASGLAFLGLDTSPGVIDVGQEYQAREGAKREAAIAKSLAETISGISARRAEALRAQQRQRDELAAARLQLEEENIQKKRDEELLKLMYGGN
jgi:hypothetical protein